MGIIVWFSFFKFNWLRRCRICRVRGSKCLCRRPSLTLEHIFFLEERKNKFGGRNFNHVSDTMMTSNGTMFANSTNCTDPAIMRNAEFFVNNEVNETDYYFQSAPTLSNASDSDGELLILCMDSKNEMQLCVNSRRDVTQCKSSKVLATADASTTALVSKYSRCMMSNPRHKNTDKNIQPSIAKVVTNEFILYTEDSIPVSLPHGQQQKQLVPHNQSQSRIQTSSAKMTNTHRQHKGESGVSFQFFGCSGPASSVSTLLLSSKSSCSNNDSFMIGSSSISSMRVSQFSDRMSLEANFGSFNLQPNLSNTGRFVESSGYALSIKEDEEAQALEKLTGWLHASSVSTQDSFMLLR
ncbi:unnamed protein product [Peronospora destructor]|uniref:Uncharacterized protein n=1 Tax=Peronospora destructor TaxID=86335 RepID=A0AAV0U849_9STRA|nr:unnamed protein product [Peronospora destructor]CAI5731638.1 unnamed protein product [Peronospora destructor]